MSNIAAPEFAATLEDIVELESLRQNYSIIILNAEKGLKDYRGILAGNLYTASLAPQDIMILPRTLVCSPAGEVLSDLTGHVRGRFTSTNILPVNSLLESEHDSIEPKKAESKDNSDDKPDEAGGIQENSLDRGTYSEKALALATLTDVLDQSQKLIVMSFNQQSWLPRKKEFTGVGLWGPCLVANGSLNQSIIVRQYPRRNGSLEFRILLSKSFGNSGHAGLFWGTNGDDSSVASAWSVLNDGTLRMSLHDGRDWNEIVTKQALSQNEWHHVLMTWGTKGQYIFVDGENWAKSPLQNRGVGHRQGQIRILQPGIQGVSLDEIRLVTVQIKP